MATHLMRRHPVTTKTSKGITEGNGAVQFVLSLTPVPAPRPRIRVLRLKGGKTMGVAYYAGKYKDFLAEAPTAIPESTVYFEKGTPVEVCIDFRLPRPQKPANPYPVGDVDNYCKSILDAITKNGTYWKDDAQIVYMTVAKRYVEEGEEPGHTITIGEAEL